jgi:hypothetical protein
MDITQNLGENLKLSDNNILTEVAKLAESSENWNSEIGKVNSLENNERKPSIKTEWSNISGLIQEVLVDKKVAELTEQSDNWKNVIKNDDSVDSNERDPSALFKYTNISNLVQKILIDKDSIIDGLNLSLNSVNITVNKKINNTAFFKYLMSYLKNLENVNSDDINKLEKTYHEFVLEKNKEIFKTKVKTEISEKNRNKIPAFMISFLEEQVKSPRHSQEIVNFIGKYPENCLFVVDLSVKVWIEKLCDFLRIINQEKLNVLLKKNNESKNNENFLNNLSYVVKNVKDIRKLGEIIQNTNSAQLDEILNDDAFWSENLTLHIDEVHNTLHLSAFINNAAKYLELLNNVYAKKLMVFIESLNISNFNTIVEWLNYEIDKIEHLINNINNKYLLNQLISEIKPAVLIKLLESDINIEILNFINLLDNTEYLLIFLEKIENPWFYIKNIKSEKLTELSSLISNKTIKILNEFEWSANFVEILNTVDSDRFIKTLEQTIDIERFTSLIQNVNYEKVVWIINNINIDIFISVLNNVNDIEIFTKKLAKLEDYTDFIILIETINVHVFIKLIEVWEIFEFVNKSSDLKILVNFLNITPINILKQLLIKNLYSEYVQLIENIEEEMLSAFLDEVKVEKLLSYLNTYYDSWVHNLIDFIKWSKNLERVISVFNLYENDSLHNLLRNLGNIEKLNDYLDISKISPAILVNTTNTTNLAIVLDNAKLLNFWMLTDSIDSRKIAYIINNIDDISNFISTIDFMNTVFLSKLIIKWNNERIANFLNEIDVNCLNDLIEKSTNSYDIFIDKLLLKISKNWAEKVARIINDKWRLPNWKD